MGIDSNSDGVFDQVYTNDYGIPTGGSGIGLGLYGTAQADNFGVPGGAPVPEPASLTLLGTGLIGLIGLVRRRF